MAAAQQRGIARQVLIIAAALCTILFAYVIFTQRHNTPDQVGNSNMRPVDQQILGGTKTALPLRHQAPTKFGVPTNNTVPADNVAVPVPSLYTTSTVPGITHPGAYSNLPPTINPHHPISVNMGPGGSTFTPHATTTQSTASQTTMNGKPVSATTQTSQTGVPLSSRPAYTVLVKGPGDRTRKAVVVNH